MKIEKTGTLENPRPFLFVSMLMSILLMSYLFWTWDLFLPFGFYEPMVKTMSLSTLFTVLLMVFSVIFFYAIKSLAVFGAEIWENCYWTEGDRDPIKSWIKRDLTQESCKEKPLTYWNAFRWTGEGVLAIIVFFVLMIWWLVMNLSLLIFKFITLWKRRRSI
jgi:hypothetical protein